MVGLIMAAGKGSRIASETQNLPKSFLKLGPKKLIDHQVDTLLENGIEKIIIVTGFKSDLIQEYYKNSGFLFVKNPFYEITNVLASVWFAIDHISEGFYFMHADAFFEPKIFTDLMNKKGDVVLSVSKKKTVEEDMKVIVKNSLIKLINKEMDCNKAYGEFIGLAKFSSNVTKIVTSQIKKRIEDENGKDFFFERVIQDLIDTDVDVYCHDIGDQKAIEIDFPYDYLEAKKIYNILDK